MADNVRLLYGRLEGIDNQPTVGGKVYFAVSGEGKGKIYFDVPGKVLDQQYPMRVVMNDEVELADKALKDERGNNIIDYLKTLTQNGNKIIGKSVSGITQEVTSIPFIVGAQTGATNAWTGSAPTISSLYDGLTILYYLPQNGNGNAVSLNLTIAGSKSTGAIPCYYKQSEALKNHFTSGSVLLLTYRQNATAGGSSTSVSGWFASAQFEDGNNEIVASKVSNGSYPILGSQVTEISENGTSTEGVVSATEISMQPATGTIKATNFQGLADKATHDAQGREIFSTYIQDITVEKGDNNEHLINISRGGKIDTLSLSDIDTHVYADASNITKAYLMGSTTSDTGVKTATIDSGIYISTTPGELVATQFTGALSGNASSATKATQDSQGQQINTTYIKEIDINGQEVTITKGNGTIKTITTQDNDTKNTVGATLSEDKEILLTGINYDDEGQSFAQSYTTGLVYYDGQLKADSFLGNLEGNADSADKALKDNRNQQIDSTYIKNITASGQTVTFTRGDGTTGTFQTQDTNTNTDINVTQTVTTTGSYPLLLSNITDGTTKTTTSRFDSGVKLDTSTNTITANISGKAASASKADVVDNAFVGVSGTAITGGTTLTFTNGDGSQDTVTISDTKVNQNTLENSDINTYPLLLGNKEMLTNGETYITPELTVDMETVTIDANIAGHAATADKASSADKATYDSSNQKITEYIMGLELQDDGRTISIIKGNGNSDQNISIKDMTYSLPLATSTTLGGVKLYNTTSGESIEGVVTQKAIKEALSSAQSAAVQVANNYTNEKFDELMGEGAVEALDTIKELGDAITDNADLIQTLEDAIINKSEKGHTHLYAGSSTAGGVANAAIADEDGDNIRETYIKNLSASGTTITVTKGDGSTSTISTQDKDTKNTAGSTNTSKKIYLIGAESQEASPQTYSHDTVFIDSNGKLNAALVGNADSATKADNDSENQKISETYIKDLSISGTTITYTKGDGKTGTITTQDTNIDTKNTTGATDTSSKIFLIGATAQTANPQTYSHDTVYIDTDGKLNAALKGNADTATKATNDIRNQKIDETYIKDLSISGTTLTVVKGDGTTSTITTQDTNIDTKNTTGADNTSSKIFLVGATAQTSGDGSARTYTHDTVYVGTDGKLHADLIGNADTATHANYATGDSGTGNTIREKYVSSVTASGQTVTVTKGNGDTSTFITPDTKNTAGSTDTSSKIYLIGAASQATNPQTYSHDTVFVDTDGKIHGDLVGNASTASRASAVGWNNVTDKPNLVSSVELDSTETKIIVTDIAGATTTLEPEFLKNTGGSVTGDLTMYAASGDSPAVVFQRGTLTNNYNDWRIQDRGGYLYFDQRGSGSTDWQNIFLLNQTGGEIQGTLKGTLNGNASSATKATYDSTGTQDITKTYIKGLSVSGRTITYTKGDGTTGTIITQDNNTDTKNTAGSTDTSSKIFLIGATTQSENPQTYSHDTVYVNTNGKLHADLEGNADTATTLKTSRAIALTKGIEAEASFNGAADIELPIESIKEAYLTWGGKNFSSSYSPIDAAMVPVLGANRFEFAKAKGITIEYSRDSGATWTDYGLSDYNKTAIFSSVGGQALIGKADSSNKATAAYQLRVTLDTGKASIYTVLNKIIMYVSTNGSSGCTCTIERALQSTPTAYSVIADAVPISGWSGWNVINIPATTTYGNNASSQYGRLRFTFKCTGGSTSYNGLQILQIHGYGGMGWATPSTMAKTGHLYSYNASQEATFPAKVTAPTFVGNLSGTATKATSADYATGDSGNDTIRAKYISNITAEGSNITVKKGNGDTAASFTIPDTKNTAGATNPSNTIYLIGAESRTANPQTYSSDKVYISTDGKLHADLVGNATTATEASSVDWTNIENKPSAIAATVAWDTNKTTMTVTDINGAATSTTPNFLPLSGGTITGTLVLSKTTDLSGVASNSPALIIGGAVTSTHIEMDANEIQAKASETTVSALYLNNDGGLVNVGTGGMNIAGNVTLSTGKSITASNFVGLASKATADGSGDNIRSNYLKSVTRDDGGVVTVSKGDGTTSTFDINRAGSTNTSSKIYLIGAETQAASKQTYSHDTVYVGTDGKLYATLVGNADTATKASSVDWGNIENNPEPYKAATLSTSSGELTFVKTNGSVDEENILAVAPLVNGKIPLTFIPEGAQEKVVIVSSLTERDSLTTSQIQVGDTVKVTANNTMYYVSSQDSNGVSTFLEYAAGHAVTADSATNATNATNATYATYDSSSKKITDTYLKSISNSNWTLTSTLGSGSTGQTVTLRDYYINSASWTAGSTSGPILKLARYSSGSSLDTLSATIPSATSSTSGVVTTGNQTFAGIKTFSNTTASSNKSTGAVLISGGLGVAGRTSANEVMIGDHFVLKYNSSLQALEFVYID